MVPAFSGIIKTPVEVGNADETNLRAKIRYLNHILWIIRIQLDINCGNTGK